MGDNRSPGQLWVLMDGLLSYFSFKTVFFLWTDKWLPERCRESKSEMHLSKKHLTKRLLSWSNAMIQWVREGRYVNRTASAVLSGHLLQRSRIRCYIKVSPSWKTLLLFHKHYLRLVDRLERRVGQALLEFSLPVSSSSSVFNRVVKCHRRVLLSYPYNTVSHISLWLALGKTWPVTCTSSPRWTATSMCQ